MKHDQKILSGLLWVLLLHFAAAPAHAQDQTDQSPKPAARDNSALLDVIDIQQDQDPGLGVQSVQPDDRPLSGVQNPTIGSPASRHSYWVPAIQYGNATRSNSLGGNNAGWNTTNFVSTNVSLLESWSHSTLTANYSGGGYFSTDPVQGSQGDFQQLAANYEFDGKRWQMFLIDQFSYLPQSSFGFGAGSGLATAGVSGGLAVPVTSLQPAFVPGQTNLAALGPQYNNSSAAQFTYKTSARGSFTVAGVYGLLRFVNPGSFNSDMEMGSVGYDYLVSRKDTIGVNYRFGAYRFPGEPQAVGDQSIHLEYGRKITGRMALRLEGGPELTTFRIPIANAKRAVSGSGSASLTYNLAASTGLEIHYTHGVSGGSGVFTGSTGDQLGAGVSKRLTRVWNGNLNFGYARYGQIVTTPGSLHFDNWFAGAGLSRSIGHMTYFSLGYQAQIQTGVAIPGSTSNAVHQIYLSFQWHTRPFVLR